MQMSHVNSITISSDIVSVSNVIPSKDSIISRIDMESERCWMMWDNKKKNTLTSNSDHHGFLQALVNNNNNNINKKASSFDDSWEEQAFAEDAAGHLGGCVWPPRSYSCSFCKREFRSAQALGGHMNVHRRDRARLKHESLKPQIETPKNNPFMSWTDLQQHSSSQLCNETLSFNPNPNPKSSSSFCLSALPSQNLVEPEWHQSSNHSIKTSDLFKDDDYDAAVCCKRKRTNHSPSTVPFLFRSEVIGLSHSSAEDLDLELRLGNGGGHQKPKLK